MSWTHFSRIIKPLQRVVCSFLPKTRFRSRLCEVTSCPRSELTRGLSNLRVEVSLNVADEMMAKLFGDNRFAQGRRDEKAAQMWVEWLPSPCGRRFPNLPKKTETWATTINFKTIDSEAGVGVFCFPPAETREQSERQFALKAAIDHRKLPTECFIPAALFVSCNSDELSTRHHKHCKPLHLMFLFLAVRLSKQQPADNKN